MSSSLSFVEFREGRKGISDGEIQSKIRFKKNWKEFFFRLREVGCKDFFFRLYSSYRQQHLVSRGGRGRVALIAKRGVPVWGAY